MPDTITRGSEAAETENPAAGSAVATIAAREHSTYTTHISGARITVDPHAFGEPEVAGNYDLTRLGVSIDDGEALRYASVPEALSDPFLRLFRAVQASDTVEIEDACAEIMRGLAVAGAKTITAQEPITSVPLPGNYLPIPSTSGVRAVVTALNNATSEHWKLNSQHRMAYQYMQPKGTVEVSVDAIASEAYALLAKLNDDKAIDTLLILLAHVIKRAAKNGDTEILSATILDERGTNKRKKSDGVKTYSDGYRREEYQEIDDHVRLIEKLWVALRRVEAYVNGKRSVFTEEGRCLVVTERILETRDDGLHPRIVGWRYRLGDALKALGSDKQFGHLARKSLKYDPYREHVEKRLARHFAFFHRIQRGRPVCHAVDTIITQCGIEIDTRNPARTRDRIEAALSRLVADGVIKSWKYVEESILPARAWLPRWRQWAIEVVIAEDNPTKLTTSAMSKQAGDTLSRSIGKPVEASVA